MIVMSELKMAKTIKAIMGQNGLVWAGGLSLWFVLGAWFGGLVWWFEGMAAADLLANLKELLCHGG